MTAETPHSRRVATSPLDSLIAGFAAWTVAANAVVFAGGGLRLLALAGVGAVLGVSLLARRQRRSDPSDEPTEPTGNDAHSGGNSAERAAVLVAGALAAGLSAWRADPSIAWLIGLPLLWYQFARSSREPLRIEPPTERAVHRSILWGLAVACALVTLVAQRADVDDTFYVNIAVSTADHPGAAILVADTMHGVPGVALSLEAYRVQSYELLAGLLAWLTPLRALDVLHVVFPALSALLIPFALARVFRSFLPRAWLWAVLFGIAFLWLSGSPHRGFGNFGFVRLQQGKAVLLCVVLPLTVACALEYAAQPTRRRWLLLAAVQIAALGTNVTALVLAPTMAAVGLCAALSFERPRALATLAKGLATSFYPVVVGLALLATRTAPAVASGAAPGAGPSISPAASVFLIVSVVLGLAVLGRGGRTARFVAVLAGVLCASATAYALLAGPSLLLQRLGASGPGLRIAKQVVPTVFGNPGQIAFAFFALFGTWAVVSSALWRRFAALVGVVLLTVYWSPFTAEVLSARVLSPTTYWRAFWFLPATLLFGAFLAAPLERAPFARPALRRTIALSLAVVVLFLLPERTTIDRENQVAFESPGWRIPRVELEAARALVRFAPEGSFVLAPLSVSAWIPTLHHHPSPLIVRSLYVSMLDGVLDPAEIERRLRLTEAMALPPSGAPLGIVPAIEDFGLTALCMSKRAFKSRAREELGRSPFELVFENEGYVVWSKR